MNNLFEIAKVLTICSFTLNVILGVVEITLSRPQFSCPSNMGWIVILGLLTIINRQEN